MSVYCSCDYELEPGDIKWFNSDDFKSLSSSRRQRCRSCGELINLGSDCVEFHRAKIPDHDVECAIYGEDGEIQMASHFLCEECGGIWFSLYELGLCVDYDCNQRDNVAEFNSMQEGQRKAEEVWRKKFGL